MPKVRTIIGNMTGISLVEMMIAMLISMILLGGIYRVFISTTTGYQFEAELSNIQENGRFAMEFLTRDTRQTGYRGCAGSSTAIINTLNDSSNFFYNFGTAIEGYDDVADPPAAEIVAAGITPLAGSDVLVLRMQNSDGLVGVVRQKDNPTVDLKISNTENPPIADGDIVMVSDCIAATVFEVTNVTFPGGATDANLVHNTGMVTVTGNSTADLGHSYEQGGEIFKMATMAYFVDTDANGDVGLYYKLDANQAEMIVSGVETMQVTYGVDTDADRDIDTFVDADAVADWATVLAVRIGILVASTNEVQRGDIDTAIYTVNGTNVPAANDRRMRQVFTTTVALRNRLP